MTLLAAIDLLGLLKTVLGIGSLILVHELGHFLVGRWCGVRADAFSIGFPPNALCWKPGETEYRFGMLPLGGYVKFAGEYEEGITGESDEPGTFQAATYPRKAAIMLAGVAMNVVAAFVLFAVTFRAGVQVSPPIVGGFSETSPAWAAGLEVGDEIATVDGHAISDFLELINEVALREEVELGILRDGELLPPITVRTHSDRGGVRRLGVEGGTTPTARLAVDDEESAAWKAGFRDGDEVVSVDGNAFADSTAALRYALEQVGPTTWTVRRDEETLELVLPRTTRTSHRVGVVRVAPSLNAVRSGSAAARVGLRSGEHVVGIDDDTFPTTTHALIALAGASPDARPTLRVHDSDGKERTVQVPTGTPPAEFASGMRAGGDAVWVALPDAGDSAARAAGLPPLARLTEVDGEPPEKWSDLTAAVEKAGAASRDVTLSWVTPDGAEGTTTIRPAAVPQPDTGGLGQVVRPDKRLLRADSFGRAVSLGLDRCWRWLDRIVSTLGALVSGRVSARELAGPVALSKMTYETSKEGWGDLFLFLGMISMNLAVLNLLPIPALDGGQLLLLTAARIRGRPLPPRVEAGFQMAGWVMVLGLMVFVIVNDITRL